MEEIISISSREEIQGLGKGTEGPSVSTGGKALALHVATMIMTLASLRICASGL